jgi:hypothetical protein
MQEDNMAWTTKPEFDPEELLKSMTDNTMPIWHGIDLGSGEKVILTEYKDGVITHTDITEKVHSNLKPTHDPYTNPDSHIYYECGCGAILDPGTRSFAQLNNVASAKDWKVRWRKDGQGYEAFCVECGKEVD